MSAFEAINSAFDFVWWLLVIAFCLVAWRSYHLPTLPWIGAYLAITLVTTPISQWLFRSFHQIPAARSFADCAWFIGSAGELIVLLLALAEVAWLFSLVRETPFPKTLGPLRHFHRHACAWGMAAVCLAFIYPVPAIVYHLAYGTPKA
ncbi:MAG: hypothetical protein ACR2MF_01240 [Chthoniobacterales bacterium]